MENNLHEDSAHLFTKKIFWTEIQKNFKDKFGLEIYESWLKKIEFVEEQNNTLHFQLLQDSFEIGLLQDILIKYYKF